jgi:hypothetical protein
MAKTATQITPDLTHTEARAAFTALAVEVGSKAAIYVSLGSHAFEKQALSASIYPQGIGSGGATLRVEADDYRALLAAAQDKWAEHSDLHATNTIRAMALAIIAITADQGECTDAALRAQFDASDVRRHGEPACEQASAMASNGPFSIVKLTGANDAKAA